MSSEKLAYASGLSKEGLRKIESGKTDPKVSSFIKIATALGVPWNFFFKD